MYENACKQCDHVCFACSPITCIIFKKQLENSDMLQYGDCGVKPVYRDRLRDFCVDNERQQRAKQM